MSYYSDYRSAPPPGGGGGYAPPPGAPHGYGPPGGGYPPPGGAPGGFHAPPRGPPPGADPQLWNWFVAVDQDYSGAISATELQECLRNGDWKSFDLDTVKLLMTIFDTDRSGTIGFTEFAGLWKYIKDWQNVFRHFDADNSGSIDGKELENALRQFGYNLSAPLMRLLLAKYDVTATAPTSSHGPPPGISFDRFVRACVVIKQLTESFQRLDTNRTGWIQLDYESFMHTVLSAP